MGFALNPIKDKPFETCCEKKLKYLNKNNIPKLLITLSTKKNLAFFKFEVETKKP